MRTAPACHLLARQGRDIITDGTGKRGIVLLSNEDPGSDLPGSRLGVSVFRQFAGDDRTDPSDSYESLEQAGVVFQCGKQTNLA